MTRHTVLPRPFHDLKSFTASACGQEKTRLRPEWAGLGEMQMDLILEFKRCLGVMSHSRAGWDLDLPPGQRAAEARDEKEALARAREIWGGNPDRQDELRAAFSEASPLATMREIETSSQVAQAK